jgi:hypothetical protein
MPAYRLDIFDSLGAIRAVSRLPYTSDRQAIRAVEKQSQNHRMELWSGERLVTRFLAGPIPVDLPEVPA